MSILQLLTSQHDSLLHFLRWLAVDELMVLSGFNRTYRNLLIGHQIWKEKWTHFYPDEPFTEGSRLHLIQLTLDYQHRKEVTKYFLKKYQPHVACPAEKDFRKILIAIKWNLKVVFLRYLKTYSEDQVSLDVLYNIAACLGRVELMETIKDNSTKKKYEITEKILPVETIRYALEGKFLSSVIPIDLRDKVPDIITTTLKYGYFETLSFLLKRKMAGGKVYKVFVSLRDGNKAEYLDNLISLCEDDDLNEDSFIILRTNSSGHIVELPYLMLLAVECLTEISYRKFTKLYRKMDCSIKKLFIRAMFRNRPYAEYLLSKDVMKKIPSKKLTKTQRLWIKKIRRRDEKSNLICYV